MNQFRLLLVISLILSVCRGFPQSDAERFYLSGKQALENTNYLLANDEFSRSVQSDPNYTEAYVGRGQARYQLKDIERAIADFTKAIELDPLNLSAHLYRGKANYVVQNYQSSIQDLNFVLERDQSNTEALFCRAESQFQLGNMGESIADYTKLTELEPDNAAMLQSLGYARFKAGDLQGACMAWQKSLDKGNKSVDQLIQKHCK
jgi:tetratricopeptide (TPR) repeat protein